MDQHPPRRVATLSGGPPPPHRAGQHSLVMDDFLARAALRGERVVAVTRLALTAMLMVQWIVAWPLAVRTTITVGVWTSLVSYIAGATYSLWVIRYLKATDALKRHLYLSVTVDAAIVGLALITFTLFPHDRYTGLLNESNFAVLILATVATGVRLSRGAAVYGSALIVGVFVLLSVFDWTLNADRLAYGVLYTFNGVIFLLGAVVLAYTVAVRTRSLVLEGAEAAVASERARQRLGVYVSEEVAEDALARTSLRLGGRSQPAAILFSDLRGFTSYSEKRPPEAIVFELNAYLDAMVKVIRQHGGVVDKFIGDAIMAVFSLPEPRGDDAARAIRAAEGMQRALEEHNRTRLKRNKPPFAHGIGVHHGTVVAGNIGNRERLQFTVIGHPVNLASRLEAATKVVKRPVLISDDAVRAAQKAGGDLPGLTELEPLKVPGQDRPVKIYTVN